jgi:hypothetical protein
MSRNLFTALAFSILLTLSGCGSNSPAPTFSTQILSSAANDGDISILNTIPLVTQGNLASVFAGIDAASGTEYRAFLDFPLTGSGGVPGSAIIDSATLDIFIDSLAIQPTANSVPIRIDLVTFPPHPLLASDFSQTVLATRRSAIFRSDVNHHVVIDISGLMAAAQAQVPPLPDFQVRISEDLSAIPDGTFDGLVEIHEATVGRAPLLGVIYH